MQTVTLDEAKAHLVDLIEAAAGGEEVFIIKDAELSVQLVPRTVSAASDSLAAPKVLFQWRRILMRHWQTSKSMWNEIPAGYVQLAMVH